MLTASATADAQPELAMKRRPTEISTDHLRLRYTNEVDAAADRTVSLTVTVEPRPGMHVYAPGADDYQIITLTIAEQSGVRTLPIKYPPSETYFFAPLNERIPVYQKPFELILRATIANATKTLKGILDYQACDDKVCFAPVEVPLSWTIRR